MPRTGSEYGTQSAVLEAYLLGRVDFDAVRQLQRRLAYEIGGERRRGAVILCEHPPMITIGREGSRGHVLIDDEELEHLDWPIRWVGRGGGCLLHAAGQLAVYPVLALDQHGLTVGDYLHGLHTILADVLRACGVPAQREPTRAGVRVDGRLIAHVGVAVTNWVTTFGAAINLTPDLGPYRRVRCDGDDRPMTSLERERRSPVRPAFIRQQLVERLADRFGFGRLSVFHAHASLTRPPTTTHAHTPGLA